MIRDSFTIYISGVGGQGILWLSKVFARAACKSQAFVCRTEMRGLSQRGGSVCSAVRFGPHAVTPTSAAGGADLIVALDALEAARSLEFLKPSGRLITNCHFVKPAHLLMKDTAEADNLATRLAFLWEHSPDFFSVDFQALAVENSIKRMNLLVAGAASAFLPLRLEDLHDAVMDSVPDHEHESARVAFDSAAALLQNMKRNISRVPHRAA